ncbi:MAG: hypothetical protein ACI97A_001769 [Planctomycetota bacterium]
MSIGRDRAINSLKENPMSDAPIVKHTKSFKKYSDESRTEVVDACRKWGQDRPEKFELYEDASIVKLTGIQSDVDEMVEDLRGRFGTPLPGEDPPA